MTDNYHTIRYARSGNIGTLTLTRPEKRNAQNPLMWKELAELGDSLSGDETLRCLVVSGEGPCFSAGIDLVEGLSGMVTGWTEDPGNPATRASGRAAAATFSWIPQLGCASVAAVRGHAYGAGLQLALACDFRILGLDAKVGLIETRFGIFPDMGATVRLPRIVGEARARELILLGEIIDGPEALRIGLANRLVDDHLVDSVALELAERLAAQPPLAVRGARRAIDAAWHLDPEASFTVAIEQQGHCLMSDDFKEAIQAMTENRSPQWQGR